MDEFYGIGAIAVIVVLLVIADWVREEWRYQKPK